MNAHRINNPIKSAPKFRIHWSEVAATAVVTALVVGGTAWAFNIATERSEPAVEATTPECATDESAANSEGVSPSPDSNGCFWDAEGQGSGTGESFYVDDEGNVYYLPVAVTDTPEYKTIEACAKQMSGFARDAMTLSTDLAGQWAQSEFGETTYGEWVVTDNLQPMQDRFDYLLKTFCSDSF